MKLVSPLSPSSTFAKDIEMILTKRNSRLSDEYVKVNPQVKQEWIQVFALYNYYLQVYLSYNVCADNAQNKRLDCSQLQCIVIS